MKRFAILSIVLILLASMVMPAMAGNGNGNGHGNGNNNGGGNGNTTQDQVKTQDREKNKDQNKHANRELGKFKNSADNKWMTTPFYLQGVVKSVGANSITVTVTHANAKAKAFIGQDLVIAVNDATQIFQVTQGDEISGTEEISGTTDRTGTSTLSTGDRSGEDNENDEDGGRTPITLSQITAGQSVAVHGRFFTPDYVARLITVYLGHGLGEPIDSKTTTP